MDFTKFLSILEKNALFFPNLTSLSKVDPLEGSLSEKTVKEFKKSIDESTEDMKDHVKGVVDHNLTFFKNCRNIVCVNSWHMSNYESTAMWSVYLKSNEGIAIQSTFESFRDSFENSGQDIFIGAVQYIDSRRKRIQMNNIFNIALCKRKSYEYEKELRAIVLPSNYCKHGMYVSVNLERLISNIYVAPNAPQWFKELLESMMTRYQLRKMIKQSTLSKGPLY